MTHMVWVYVIAAATALALAEHWLRYALVECKRARRVAARLERIRAAKERREDARFRDCPCISCRMERARPLG